MKKVDNYINEVITNIRKDREVTKELLSDIIVYLSGNEERHGEVGTVAAKYVETLQRSNEQLVKLIGIRQKETTKSIELSEQDKSEIFDILSSSEVSN